MVARQFRAVFGIPILFLLAVCDTAVFSFARAVGVKLALRIILLFFGFSFLFVSDAKTGDDKKVAVQWLIGLFLFFCSFLSIIILSKISIIFFLLLLGGVTILWSAAQDMEKKDKK